ncbi:MAG: extracellular solute-binding protein [Caldilineaceae bacterium]|nr:extracellular solute-binding protein [Caldilineaceae bacterium]
MGWLIYTSAVIIAHERGGQKLSEFSVPRILLYYAPMINRRFALAMLPALALLLLALLSGCSGLTPRLPERITQRAPAWLLPKPAPPPMALSVWAWSESEVADKWLRDQIDAFIQERAAIAEPLTVTLSLLPDYPAALDELAADALTGTRPDLLLLDLYRLPYMQAAGALQPLPAQALFADDLYPQLRDGARVGGELYCLPFEVNTLALIYNRTLFNAAGITYPSAGWTWTEMEAAAAAISALPTDHFTAYGLVLPVDMTRWLPWLTAAGGRVVDDAGAPALEAVSAREAISTYVELITQGPAVEPGHLEASWGGEALGIGRVGMTLEGNWVMPYLATEHPNTDAAVAPLPGPGVAFATCWAITSRDPDRRTAAVDLLARLTAPGALDRRMTTTAAIPARPSLASAWRTRYPAWSPFLDGIDQAQLWQLPADLMGLPRVFNRALRAVIDGDETAADMSAQILDAMQSMQREE